MARPPGFQMWVDFHQKSGFCSFRRRTMAGHDSPARRSSAVIAFSGRARVESRPRRGNRRRAKAARRRGSTRHEEAGGGRVERVGGNRAGGMATPRKADRSPQKPVTVPGLRTDAARSHGERRATRGAEAFGRMFAQQERVEWLGPRRARRRCLSKNWPAAKDAHIFL